MGFSPYNMNKAKIWGAVKCGDYDILRAIAIITDRTTNTSNLRKLIPRATHCMNDRQ